MNNQRIQEYRQKISGFNSELGTLRQSAHHAQSGSNYNQQNSQLRTELSELESRWNIIE